ncbi:MAG: hypothetical protein JW806_02090 [Sedimentisphaerales bacterium]|nr:hypothetical protein [Sedimentisphaerales bacterium]
MDASLRKALAVWGIVFLSFSSVFAYSGGSGEPNDPYRIGTVADWQEFMNDYQAWDEHYILINDLDLNGVELKPVGHYYERFEGVFNGNGHLISNLTIYNKYDGRVGLFGCIGPNSVVKDLGVEDADITGMSALGALVGINAGGKIVDCYSTGSIKNSCSSHGGYVGGLVGYSDGGSIINCYSDCIVEGLYWVGGLVGYNGSNITNCYSTGTVSGEWGIGGLVGITNSNSIVTNCYSTVTVTKGGIVGGLVGGNGGIIRNCYSNGVVSGDICVGGLAGSNDGIIGNCYSARTVDGNDIVGGLVGYHFSEKYDGQCIAVIENCYAAGEVIGDSNVGGLVGYNTESNDIAASFWDIETSGQMTSAGGTGLPTAQMQDIDTFLNAGWDFVGETANGTEDIWTICDGFTYPVFDWQNAVVQTDVRIVPRVINRASRVQRIIARIKLPAGITKDDVGEEHFVLFPADAEEGIEAVWQRAYPWRGGDVRVIAMFSKEELMELIPDNGRVELQVVGELNTGQFLCGQSSVHIIGRGRGK